MLKLRHIFLFVVVIMVAMAGLVVLRHYVPQVKALFQAVGVEGHMTWVETQVMNAVSNNPGGVLGIFGAIATTGITIITKLVGKISSIRQTASDQITMVQNTATQTISSVKGQAEQEAQQLLSTIQTQKEQLSQLQGEKNQFNQVLASVKEEGVKAKEELLQVKSTIAGKDQEIAELKLQIERQKIAMGIKPSTN